jgi:hypothetical protein
MIDPLVMWHANGERSVFQRSTRLPHYCRTHWPGPNNDKFRASVICGWNLRGLASA